jgi:hypothetical protein
MNSDPLAEYKAIVKRQRIARLAQARQIKQQEIDARNASIRAASAEAKRIAEAEEKRQAIIKQQRIARMAQARQIKQQNDAVRASAKAEVEAKKKAQLAGRRERYNNMAEAKNFFKNINEDVTAPERDFQAFQKQFNKVLKGIKGTDNVIVEVPQDGFMGPLKFAQVLGIVDLKVVPENKSYDYNSFASAFKRFEAKAMDEMIKAVKRFGTCRIKIVAFVERIDGDDVDVREYHSGSVHKDTIPKVVYNEALNARQLQGLWSNAKKNIIDRFEEKAGDHKYASKFNRMVKLQFQFAKVDAIKGSSYIPLPKWLVSKKCCINPQNEDDECFKWAISASMAYKKLKESEDLERVSKLKNFLPQLNLDFSNISFPTTDGDWETFEKQNNLGLNVYTLNPTFDYDKLAKQMKERTAKKEKYIKKQMKERTATKEKDTKKQMKERTAKKEKYTKKPRLLKDVEKDRKFVDESNRQADISVFDEKEEEKYVEENEETEQHWKLVYLHQQPNAEHIINLLLVEDEEKSHYVWIKKLQGFIAFGGREHHLCEKCGQMFKLKSAFDNHITKNRCVEGEHSTIWHLPAEGENVVEFRNHKKALAVPFHIIADTESILIKVDEQRGNSTQIYQVHEASHVGCLLVSDFPEILNGEYKRFYGKNCVTEFLEYVKEIEEKAYQIVSTVQQMEMTEDDKKDFWKSKRCHICDEEFDKQDVNLQRVRDHCHITGKYRGPAHRKCNLWFNYARWKLPVYFHNLKGYDSHFIFQQAGKMNWGEISVIPMNLEKYLSFSIGKTVFMDSCQLMPSSLDSLVENLNKEELIERLDTHQFVKSLSPVEYISFCKKTDLKIKFKNQIINSEFIDALSVSEKVKFLDINKVISGDDKAPIFKLIPYMKLEEKKDSCFGKFNEGFKHLPMKIRLALRQKGFMCYEYYDSYDRLKETEFPPKKAFKSTLTNSEISDEDYEYAKMIYELLGCNNFGDYLDLYLKCDVLLLADVMANFRKICFDYYGLDCLHYFTSPGLAWDAMLKMTGVKIECFTDAQRDMLEMVKDSIRGGISMISKRFAEANNPDIQNFDKNQPTSYIMYWDANNLYGWAMSRFLPTKDYKWVDEKDVKPSMSTVEMDNIVNEIEKNVKSALDSKYNEEFEKHMKIVKHLSKTESKGYIYEVDIHIPEALHDLFNDYPIAPELKEGEFSPLLTEIMKTHKIQETTGIKKLVPNLNDKIKYVVHKENLDFYVSLGAVVTKVHRVLEFTQSPFMAPYIFFNTVKRSQAKNEFEKDFFKLMNNSVFGKSMENVENRIDVKMCTLPKQFVKFMSRPYAKGFKVFSNDIVAVNLGKTVITYDKPMIVGFAILELSKKLMYDFHYNTIKRRYGNKAQLLFTDTDSLCYHIETEDVYEDMKEMKEQFDFSDYEKTHPLYSTANKKVIGKFKDEAGGLQITRFCGLRPKMYAFDIEKKDRTETKTRAKGVQKCVAKAFKMESYMMALFGKESHEVRQQVINRGIRSFNHKVCTVSINKIGLCALDNKRYVLADNINTLAHGHYKIKEM